jgi:glycosyltransferase involved in cell wall biosynthesis
VTDDTPLVSCVVPVYNGEAFIADALESILAQTHRRLEVIVVDDGSTDGTAGILAEFGSRVSAIRQPNQGPAAARNLGIARASGTFIAFLDADDLWYSDKLTRQLARFRERPELVACFAAYRNVSGVESADGDPMLDPAAWPVTPFSPCTLLARREVFELVGTFDPTLRRGEDTEWMMRMMLRKVPYESMPEVLLDRRIHRDNLTREQPPTYSNVVDAIKLVLDRRRVEGW